MDSIFETVAIPAGIVNLEAFQRTCYSIFGVILEEENLTPPNEIKIERIIPAEDPKTFNVWAKLHYGNIMMREYVALIAADGKALTYPTLAH